MMSDAPLLIRRYRWELYVNAFVDLLQVVLQVVIYTASATYLWVLLFPHVVSIVAVFTFFSTSDDSGRSRAAGATAFVSQVSIALTLLTDAFLALLLAYSIVECAAFGHTTFRTAFMFGTNICQGPRYDGGFVEALTLVLAAGSVLVQTSQLMTLEKVARLQSPTQKGGFVFVILTIALSMYTYAFLLYREKYVFVFLDTVSLTTSGFAMFLQFMLPANTMLDQNQKQLKILDYVLYASGWVVSLTLVALVIADKAAGCPHGGDGDLSTSCTFSDTFGVVCFCIIVFLRVVTQMVFRFVSFQDDGVTSKFGLKRR